ncbi:MAG: class I tRNA ligase family protein, partial [Nanoarchaeota archaeon]
AHIGSPHVDVVWTEETVFSYRNALERIYSLAENLREIKSKPGRQKSFIDEWLLSRVHAHLRQVEKAMKEYDLRELASKVYFGFYDDMRWYLRRGGDHSGTIAEVMEIWCQLMNPITPHLSEELNELGGYVKGLASISSWPVTEEKKINLKAEVGEELVRGTLEGMRNVLKLAKIDTPKKYTLFVAEKWLYQLFETISAEIKVTHNLGELMRRVLAVEELEMKGKEISKIVPGLLKDTSKIPLLVISQDEEVRAMKEALKFLEKEFNCKVEMVLAEESEHPKAKSALPGKVGILVE